MRFDSVSVGKGGVMHVDAHADTEGFFLLKPVGINVLGSLGCIFPVKMCGPGRRNNLARSEPLATQLVQAAA